MDDIAGQKFGLLTVLERAPSRKSRGYWLCQCECGNTCEVETTKLKNGHTKSCGCLNSAGELKIRTLLNKNNISFITQKRFPDCILPSGYEASFDFWVNDTYLIEYDGEQHFLKDCGTGFFTPVKVDKIHNSDNYKNQWCVEKKIPLIRIPYTQYKNLNIKDLLLSTTAFRYC